MESNLQHEDLLMQLRAKLNEEKIKLWEPPYFTENSVTTEELQNLARKYSSDLSMQFETVLHALQELQMHSVDRSNANKEFQQTGVATIRVKATTPGKKAEMLKIQLKLDAHGDELINKVSDQLGVTVSRVKLIHSGKVVKPTPSIEEQGIKNGVQIMALVMAETPEDVKKEDKLYMEMKSTRDDALLLSETVDVDDDDEYMKLEDQYGKAVEVPPAEKRALLVGLALHERARTALRRADYPLALVLLLEADRQFSECRSSILSRVDNWGALQLDIAWCYARVGALSAAADAARRLTAAEQALTRSYSVDMGTNERVLFMRLYLLQGIVAYHQNKRDEARRLLDMAEREIDTLKVDENSVLTLSELGWSLTACRAGLRATRGDVAAAHLYLADREEERNKAREKYKSERRERRAARRENNESVSGEESSEESAKSLKASKSDTEPTDDLIAEFVAMGYEAEQARAALKLTSNNVADAVEVLVAGGGRCEPTANKPSTSAGVSKPTKPKKRKSDIKKKERDAALKRLTAAIDNEEDDYLDTVLQEECDMLAQYKSLL